MIDFKDQDNISVSDHCALNVQIKKWKIGKFKKIYLIIIYFYVKKR